MESSLVSGLIKILTAQPQQMALYFTAKEIKDPLQHGFKKIELIWDSKQCPRRHSIEQYRIRAKSAKKAVPLTESHKNKYGDQEE